MKRYLSILLFCMVAMSVTAQSDRREQHKPYIDLRMLHFGILVGMHMQDIEFENVGPHMVTDGDGSRAVHGRLPATALTNRIRSIATDQSHLTNHNRKLRTNRQIVINLLKKNRKINRKKNFALYNYMNKCYNIVDYN